MPVVVTIAPDHDHLDNGEEVGVATPIQEPTTVIAGDGRVPLDGVGSKEDEERRPPPALHLLPPRKEEDHEGQDEQVEGDDTCRGQADCLQHLQVEEGGEHPGEPSCQHGIDDRVADVPPADIAFVAVIIHRSPIHTITLGPQLLLEPLVGPVHEGPGEPEGGGEDEETGSDRHDDRKHEHLTNSLLTNAARKKVENRDLLLNF